MLSIARGITFLSPIDISHRCKNLPDPVRGLWSCRSSTAKGLKVFKVCIDSSEHRGTLPPLFSHHAEGRDHQTEISTPQQAPGKAERRMCVSEGICTTKTPLFWFVQIFQFCWKKNRHRRDGLIFMLCHKNTPMRFFLIFVFFEYTLLWSKHENNGCLLKNHCA